MPGEIILLSIASTVLLLSVNAQYVYNPTRVASLPVASSPVADDTNPFVYTFNTNRVGHMAQPPTISELDHGHHQHPCREPAAPATYTPAPVYGPPSDSSISKTSDDTGDFYLFVPAFPSSSLVSEGDSIGAAPAPGGGASGVGFIPPDGALFAPPAPLFNGTPLPSPRNPIKRRQRSYRR